MSREFGEYVRNSGLVFDSKAEERNEYKKWIKGKKVYGETLTEQAHKDACDLNHIIKKYDRKGVMRLQQQVTVDEEALLDLVGFDYQTAEQNLARVRSEFEMLPSEVRFKFRNDPGEYLKYLSRPQKAADEVKEIIPKPKAGKEPEVAPEPPEEA